MQDVKCEACTGLIMSHNSLGKSNRYRVMTEFVEKELSVCDKSISIINCSKTQKVVLAGSDILFMRRLAPVDREISFNLQFCDDGVITGINARLRQKCDSDHGNCSIAPGEGDVSAHTHPRGERVSASNLMVSVAKHPIFGGKRKMSIVIAPLGFYAYTPNSDGLHAFKLSSSVMMSKLQKYIQWVGHQYQEDTQSGNTIEYVHFVRSMGFNMSYFPYSTILPTDNFVLEMCFPI